MTACEVFRETSEQETIVWAGGGAALAPEKGRGPRQREGPLRLWPTGIEASGPGKGGNPREREGPLRLRTAEMEDGIGSRKRFSEGL